MSNFKFPILIIILAFVQVVFLEYVKVFNVKPDLLLISAVIASFIFRGRYSLALVLFAGLIKDIFGSNSYGINILLFSLWYFLIVILSRQITMDNSIIRLALIFIISIFHNLISGLMLFYLGKPLAVGIFIRTIIFASIYTTTIFPLIYNLSINKITFNLKFFRRK